MKDKDPVIARDVPDVYTFVGTFDNAQAIATMTSADINDEDLALVQRREATRSSHADDTTAGHLSSARTAEEMTVDRLITFVLREALGDTLLSCSCRRPFSKVKHRGKKATASPTELRVTVPHRMGLALQERARMALLVGTDIDMTWDV